MSRGDNDGLKSSFDETTSRQGPSQPIGRRPPTTHDIRRQRRGQGWQRKHCYQRVGRDTDFTTVQH
eukprot:294627-Pyramimonas_sp.AAC.1